MVGEIPVPEFEVRQKFRIVNPGMGLDVSVDPPSGKVLEDFSLLEPRVKWVKEGEECQSSNFSSDDESRRPELRLRPRQRLMVSSGP